MEYSWIITPQSESLHIKARWAQLTNNQYASIRHSLLVVESNPLIKNGPAVEQMDWPVNSEYVHQNRKRNIIKYTAGINESITSAITQQFTTELISKINAGLGDKKILSATLSAELQEKVNKQLTESLSRGLSTTRSFEYQEEKEVTETLKFTVPDNKKSVDIRKVTVYTKVKEFRWDVYLYKSEYLQLEYHKSWFWNDVRKTIQIYDIVLKEPLFSIVFYEPIPALSYCFDEYSPEVNNMTEIIINKVISPCPFRTLPDIPSLDKLAKLAFPVTKEEKKDALVIIRKQKKFAKAKAAAKGIAHKKAAAKKAAPKKVAAKKTATKGIAPKKSAVKKAKTIKAAAKAKGATKIIK